VIRYHDVTTFTGCCPQPGLQIMFTTFRRPARTEDRQRCIYSRNNNNHIGFEVLTAVSTKTDVFWVVAPCSLVEVYQRFRGPCCLHHQTDNGTKVKSEVGPPPVIDYPNLPRDTRVKVTLVTRPLLTPVAQLRTWCVHSPILLRIEIVCCYS
jgi:hypothetical protein